ncbi:hypothetical protein GCM10010168_35820 [Actinoplanes ianthinogenes]|uniref:Uncharacterized protein n=1 Tax=Actinoplanes ianthinogenes TaxID=122358 RepID=A0ABM7M5N7_9ACTN|nr:hypothetical protein [Actinoplanes ianthinogenes]BCJ46898.1 hypothetical protein Aiant_75550 [Actinoplanes ianthinogenes]GGR14784.1 hypothetical protein GCM10010168_35820 [Actinoplanes ianthinogenes]
MPEPFRWDLIRPDELGSLLDGTEPPGLWFLDELVTCAGKVLARSGGGDLVFVGRSLDSMFDLLGGALHGIGEQRLDRLPLSFSRAGRRVTRRRWERRPLTAAQRDEARRMLADAGVTPYTLARRSRPVAFVDVVSDGGTFTDVYTLLTDWIRGERETWPAIRRKLRFVGVTVRAPTSPKTWRWARHQRWTAELPARSVLSVSLGRPVWSYFGNEQTKLTRSLGPDWWLAEADGPGREDLTRQALAEAVALVAYGRSRAGRQALARAVGREPDLAQPWLRTLVTELNAAAGGRRSS